MVQGLQRAVAEWQGLDEPEERARDVFTPIVVATLIVGAIGLLVITPFIAINKPGSAALSLSVFLAAGLSWLCMRKGRARLGAILIVAMFWCVQTILIVFSNGGFIGSAYVFTTLLAGLALGTRAAWMVGGLGILALGVTTALSLLHVQPPLLFPAPYAARASFSIAILLGALWALHVFIRRMETAFSTAAHELAERKRTEQQVQRRAEDFEEAQRLAQSGSWGIRHRNRRTSLVSAALPHPRPRPGHDGAQLPRVHRACTSRRAGPGRGGVPQRLRTAPLHQR